jgi:hypothetical protein
MTSLVLPPPLDVGLCKRSGLDERFMNYNSEIVDFLSVWGSFRKA